MPSVYRTNERIFHITSAEEFDRLLTTGRLSPPSLATEGFVHCSTAGQVVDTTARYFDDDAELVLVELDPDATSSDLEWPEVYPGQRFPHLHRTIETNDVIRGHRWGPSERRSWQS